MSIDIEEAGSPRRKTKQEDTSHEGSPESGSPADQAKSGSSSEGESSSAGESSSEGGSSPEGRKTRVSVTPKDPNKLEEVAEELGLPKSKVYNAGFQALLEKLGRK